MHKTIIHPIFALMTFILLLSSPSFGQQPTAQPAQPAQSTVRKLAPHVFYKVDPFLESGKSFDRHDIAELLAVNPDFEFAKAVAAYLGNQ